jgi:arylsulfatase A-like enzyme
MLAIVFLAKSTWAQDRVERYLRGKVRMHVARQTTIAEKDKMPQVDRLAKDGAIITDWYSRQSCTSGNAAFTTGQYHIRTGLGKEKNVSSHIELLDK